MSSTAEKTSNSAFIEGDGIFRDFNGSVNDRTPIFETKNPQEWEEHCKKAHLTMSGSMPCVVCSTKVEFTDLPVGKNAVCTDCKKELAK